MGKLKIILPALFIITLLGAAYAVPDQKGIDSLRKELKESKDEFQTVDLKASLAKKLRNQAPTEALKEAREALKLADKLRYIKGAAASNDIIGSIYLNKSDYKASLYHHFLALRLYNKINDQKGQALTTNNIGSVYFQLKRYEDARHFYEKSLELKLKLGLKKEANSTYINLGNLLLKEKKIRRVPRQLYGSILDSQSLPARLQCFYRPDEYRGGIHRAEKIPDGYQVL